MSPDEMFEEALPAAMRTATEEFLPPSPDIVARAVARGRRSRRTRHTGTVGAAATVAAVVGVIVVGAFGGARAPATSVSLGSGGAGGPLPTHRPMVSGQEMIRTLENLLPPGGTFTQAVGYGTDTTSVPNVSLDDTTSAGTSGFTAAVHDQSGIPRSTWGGVTCFPKNEQPYDVCTTTTLADGSVLLVNRSYEDPLHDTGQRVWYANLTRPDGVQVEAIEFSGGAAQATTSSQPMLLNTDQLTAIAESHAWDAAIDAARRVLPPNFAGAPGVASERAIHPNTP